MADLIIGGNRVAERRRADIELPVARLPTGTHLSLPLTVLHGLSSGPRIWLSAAIHGDELNGMEIIRQVVASLDPRKLRGTVVAVPIVNVFGFVNQSRYLPDRRDLNRSFPGSPKGSLAARLAYLFMNEVVAPADVGIDFHTGSDRRFNLPQIRANLDDPATCELAQAFAAPLMMHSALRDGSLRQACDDRSIPVLLFEGGEAARFDESVIEVGVAGVRRVLAHLDLIDPVPPGPPARRTTASSWVRARRSGIFRTRVAPGDDVTKGEVMGVIADVFGQSLARVRSPRDGVVIGLTLHPSVNQGDALVHVAT